MMNHTKSKIESLTEYKQLQELLDQYKIAYSIGIVHDESTILSIDQVELVSIAYPDGFNFMQTETDTDFYYDMHRYPVGESCIYNPRITGLYIEYMPEMDRTPALCHVVDNNLVKPWHNKRWVHLHFKPILTYIYMGVIFRSSDIIQEILKNKKGKIIQKLSRM